MPRPRKPYTKAVHGSTGMYSNHHCRCQPCRAAWAAYKRAYRADHPERSASSGRLKQGAETIGEVADYCRHANMGYKDGKRGTATDVRQRVDMLERFGRQDRQLIERLLLEIKKGSGPNQE